MVLCNDCEIVEDFPVAVLGTSTDVITNAGGLSFLMLANCAEDTSTLGTTLANWNAALTDQDNYRAFRDCTISGSQTENPAAEPTQVGSCGVFVRTNNDRDGIVTFVFRKDNVSADVYKFLYGMDGRDVQFSVGACDDSSLYVFRKGKLFFTESVTPEAQADLRTYTVEIRYKAKGDSYTLVGQTWKISDLVIP